MNRSQSPLRRKLTVLFLALGMVGVLAAPASAEYCVTRDGRSVVCV